MGIYNNFSYEVLKRINCKGTQAIILEKADTLDYDLLRNFNYDYKLEDVQYLIHDSLIGLIGPYSTNDVTGKISYYYTKILPKGKDYLSAHDRDRITKVILPIIAILISIVSLIFSIYSWLY